MAERIFKYYTTPDLIAQVTALGKLVTGTNGATNKLQNSNTGFRVETANVHSDDARQRYLLGRVEIWLRGQGVNGKQPDAQCLALEACDPRREKNMRVVTVYGRRLGRVDVIVD